jgi:transcriptional regulator with XRE-family HTH domain
MNQSDRSNTFIINRIIILLTPFFLISYRHIEFYSYLCQKLSGQIKFKTMTFTERIRQLREQRQLPQRKVAEALDIDSATYCKIERGERRARKEHLSILADLLQADREELLTFWLADQVTAVVAEDKELSDKVLNIAKENIKP